MPSCLHRDDTILHSDQQYMRSPFLHSLTKRLYCHAFEFLPIWWAVVHLCLTLCDPMNCNTKEWYLGVLLICSLLIMKWNIFLYVQDTYLDSFCESSVYISCLFFNRVFSLKNNSLSLRDINSLVIICCKYCLTVCHVSFDFVHNLLKLINFCI